MMQKIHAFLAVVTLTVAGLAYYQGWARFNYPSKQTFPVRGIDVSHHQGLIDWRRVSASGAKFAFIKATEGATFKDPLFQKNLAEALQNGLLVGAYHFFTFCQPGYEQAINFIASVPSDPRMLPPIIDLEFVGNCSLRPTRENLVKELSTYVSAVQRKYGRVPIYYVTHGSYGTYLRAEIDSHKIWIRDIFFEPVLKDGKEWAFWQYADRGRVTGIRGPVDLNVFRGTVGELMQLRERRLTSRPSPDTVKPWSPVITTNAQLPR